MAGSLHNAKKAKNDEFYTRYKDIAEEIWLGAISSKRDPVSSYDGPDWYASD